MRRASLTRRVSVGDLTIVGVCSFAPAVHRWLGTLREHFDGRCLLYLADPPDGIIDDLKKRYDIEAIYVIGGSGYWKLRQVGTFCAQWHCIEEACTKRIKSGLVLRTDVWDVVFQDDPRKHVTHDAEKILVSDEGVRIADEASNLDWIREWGEHFGHGRVINGGLICAPAPALAVLARIIKQAPLGTRIDQSELSLIAGALPGAFEFRPGFIECLYPAAAPSDGKGESRDEKNEPLTSARLSSPKSGPPTSGPPTSGKSWLTPRVGVAGRATVIDGKFCDRATGRPWCVVHGNGPAKQTLDDLYPIANYL